MHFTRVKLDKWKNFIKVELQLTHRAFLVGPNASGKSNFLDAFKFLRDVADEQGGFLQAVSRRGGVSQLRSLHARRYPNIGIEVGVGDGSSQEWTYRLEFTQDNQRRPIIKKEMVTSGDVVLLDRPTEEDKRDTSRLTQTHIEQVNVNKEFRPLAKFFAQIRYLHLVPQLVREPERSIGKTHDPFGGDFLEQLARTPRRTLNSRLRRIKNALQVALPQLSDLRLERDEATGTPHLKGLYEHWRPNAGWQSEEQLSDGTLRLLGLLWVLLDGSEPLLLEEPELSLHNAIVRLLPPMMARVARPSGRQILFSTHSSDLLLDKGIASEEVFLFLPKQETTEIQSAASDNEIRALIDAGLPVADAVLPRTAPKDIHQLTLFSRPS